MHVNVLIVDDQPGDLRLIEHMLCSPEGGRFELRGVGTLAAALELLDDESFDVVLLDLSLPDSDGIATLTTCLEAAPELPVVVLTGQEHHHLGAELTREGAQDYLAKGQLDGTLLVRAILHAIERNRINQRLVRANRELHDFAHRASHDLRAPLRRISTLLGFLRNEIGESLDESGEEFMGLIEKQAEGMRALIDSLLEFARAGNTALELETLDLEDAVTTALQNLEPEIADSSAMVQVGELPAVEGDRVWVVSLLQNLLENAIKYTRDESPRVEISAELKERFCEVAIKDNGIGVEPEHLPKLFTPFTRLVNSSEFGGCGIGLSLCRAVVERHGGSIWADSEGPDCGTCIHFRLPLGEST